MESKNPINPTGDASEPVYQVMPQADSYKAPESGPSSVSSVSGHVPLASTPPHAESVPRPPAPTPPASGSGLPHDDGIGLFQNRKLIMIGGGVVLVALLGAILVFMNPFGGKEKPETTVTKLPKVWLQTYFSKEICDDQAVCGDSADPDSDGLGNYDEFIAGSRPIVPDSDGDGLADGDEVNIFKTDPVLKFTDRRDIAAQGNFTDGVEIKSGYDPLTPGLKMTESRRAQIAADTQTHKLHEPTITTLGTSANTPGNAGTNNQTTTGSTQPQNVAVSIENNAVNPASVTISVGDTVVWLNKDQAKHHISSDPHPSHTALPGLESADLSNNETYSFKFTQTGTWGYHDHLNPSIKGTVIVK